MILVSAGHHPGQTGAHFDDFVEHDEAMLWVVEIARLLGPRGLVVPPGTLARKVDFINRHSPSLAIEIHFNDAWKDKNSDGIVQRDEHVGHGCLTLYMPGSDRGRSLATAVQNSIAQMFLPDLGVREGWYRLDQSRGPDFFLARTVCPAIIVEPDFVTNAKRIRGNRLSACAAIADALLNWKGV